MKVDVQTQTATRKILKIEVPAEEVATSLSEAVAEFKKLAEIPGYRKGRAPEAMIRSRFKKQLNEHVREQLVPKSYKAAIEETELDVVNVLAATEPEPKPNEPFTFEVTVDVAPEVDLPDYKSLEIELEKTEIGDEDVDGMINRMREEQAEFKDLEEGASISEGDLVEISYTGEMDGEPMKAEDLDNPMYASSEGFWMQADERAFIPDIGEALVGLVIGDETEIEVEFDEEEPQESLHGKTASYKIKVSSARGKILPELDDAFAEKAGAEDVAGLKSRCRDVLEKQVKEAYDEALETKILSTLHESVEIEVPQSEVEMETRDRIYNMVNQYSQSGLGDDVISEHKDEIFSSANQIATSRLQTRYLLRAIAKAEGIEADEDDVDYEIVRLAQSVGKSASEVRELLIERDALAGVEQDVVQRKTMEFLVEHTTIKS